MVNVVEIYQSANKGERITKIFLAHLFHPVKMMVHMTRSNVMARSANVGASIRKQDKKSAVQEQDEEKENPTATCLNAKKNESPKTDALVLSFQDVNLMDRMKINNAMDQLDTVGASIPLLERKSKEQEKDLERECHPAIVCLFVLTTMSLSVAVMGKHIVISVC